MRETAMLKHKMARWHSRVSRRQFIVALFIIALAFGGAASLLFPQTNHAQRSPSESKSKRRILPLRVEENADGTHVSIVSDAPLTDYSSSRSGDRYYVVIPQADASLVRAARGRNFEGVQVQQRGDDVVLTFRVQSGASARVNQRFNRLDVVINSLGAIVRQTPNPNTLTPATVTTSSSAASANKNQTPNTSVANNAAQTAIVSPSGARRIEGGAKLAKEQGKSSTQNPSGASSTQTATPTSAPVGSPTETNANETTTSVTQPNNASTAPTPQSVSPEATSSGVGSFLQQNWLWLLIALFLLAVITLILFWRNLTRPAVKADGRNRPHTPRPAWQMKTRDDTSMVAKDSELKRSENIEQQGTMAHMPPVFVLPNSEIEKKHEHPRITPSGNIFWQPDKVTPAAPSQKISALDDEKVFNERAMEVPRSMSAVAPIVSAHEKSANDDSRLTPEAVAPSVAENKTDRAQHAEDELGFASVAPEMQASSEPVVDTGVERQEPRIPIIAIPHIVVTREYLPRHKRQNGAERQAKNAPTPKLIDAGKQIENPFENVSREEKQFDEKQFAPESASFHIGDAAEFDDALLIESFPIDSSPTHPTTTNAPHDAPMEFDSPVKSQTPATVDSEPHARPVIELSQAFDATPSIKTLHERETTPAIEATGESFDPAEPTALKINEHSVRETHTPADAQKITSQNQPVIDWISPVAFAPSGVESTPVVSPASELPSIGYKAHDSVVGYVAEKFAANPKETVKASEVSAAVKDVTLHEERAIEAHTNATANVIDPAQSHESSETSTSRAENSDNQSAQAVSDANAAARAAYVMQLATLNTEDALKEICAAFDDPVLEVRASAARALNRLNADRADSFTRALREATPERRRRIGAAIAESGLADEAIKRLHGAGREETYDAFSLLFLMAKAGELAPLIEAVEKHHEPEVRLSVIKLLALSGQQDALPALRRLAVRSSLPVDIRSAVMEAIYQLGASQATAGAAHVA